MKCAMVMWRSLGHLNASIGVAKAMVRLGHEVVFLGPSDIAAVVSEQGQRYMPCNAFDDLPFPMGVGYRVKDILANWRSPRAFSSMLRIGRQRISSLRGNIRFRVKQVEDTISELKPDFIVFDPFLLYFFIPLSPLRISTVALSTKSLATRDVDVPPYTSQLVPTGTRLSRWTIRACWLIRTIRYAVWSRYMELIFGLSPKSLCRVLAKGSSFDLRREWRTRPFETDLRFQSVPEWVLYPPCFDFPRSPKATSEYAFVGGCVDLRRVEPPLALDENDGRPLVVCVLTSVHRPNSLAAKRRNKFLAELRKATELHPKVRFVLSVGPGMPPEFFATLPPNAKAFDKISTIAILQRAALLISQGGGNLAKEAILLGVRHLVFPDAADQPGISARLKFHGIARGTPLKRATSHVLAGLITDALNDRTQLENTIRMRDKFLAYEKDSLPLNLAIRSLSA